MVQTLAPTNPNFQVTSFESQTSEEKVLAVLRAHPISNLPWIVSSLVLGLTPLIVVTASLGFGLSKFFPVTTTATIGFLVIWYLLIFAFAFQSFLTWYFNLYIVTNSRIVDTDFLPLFFQEISSCELAKIEDTTVSMSGFFQSIFNYGSIQIQTAGEKNEFEFAKVPNPEAVQKLIEQAIDQKNGSNPS